MPITIEEIKEHHDRLLRDMSAMPTDEYRAGPQRWRSILD
jgi:hypothetical protein